MEKVLVIDNYDSFTYNLVHYIEADSRFRAEVYRNDAISLDKVNEYEKIILSPGPGLPKDAGITKDLIERYAPTKKILGVCLGMQAIGEVYGAKLINLREVLHGVATPIKVIDRSGVLFDGLPHSFEVGRYHSWMLSSNDFPKELIITSVDEHHRPMSLKHRNFDLFGVQFHPESVLSRHGKHMIANFLRL